MLLLLAGCADLVVRPHAGDANAFDVIVQDPARVECVAGDDVRAIDVEDRAVLRGLLPGRTYTCTTPEGAVAERDTDPLPDDFPVPDVLVANDDAGWFLVQLNDGGDRQNVDAEMAYAAVLDARGGVRWYHAGLGGPDLDLTWVEGGGLLYGGAAYGGGLPPTIIDLDGEVTWEAENEPLAREVEAGWNHDAGFSADGESVYALVRENLDEVADGFIIKQFDASDGDQLWTWASSDHQDELPFDPVSSDDFDPWHANAIWDAEEADGTKLYVSLRKLSWVLKIDRASKEIEWAVGSGADFTLVDEAGTELDDSEWFYGQHDAKVIDGRLSVFDNGTWRTAHGGEDNYARVVAIDLDEANRRATLTQAWTESRGERPWKAYAWGGLDPTEDGWSVANGAFWFEDPPVFRSAVSLIDGEGEVTWRLEWDDPSIGLYRSERVPEF